jgi:hypothetical protein
LSEQLAERPAPEELWQLTAAVTPPRMPTLHNARRTERPTLFETLINPSVPSRMLLRTIDLKRRTR